MGLHIKVIKRLRVLFRDREEKKTNIEQRRLIDKEKTCKLLRYEGTVYEELTATTKRDQMRTKIMTNDQIVEQ